jgi:hypothetical protein
MKTGDSEQISYIWQFSHLKHYFGHDQATISVHGKAPEGSVNARSGDTGNTSPNPSTKRPPIGEVSPEPHSRLVSEHSVVRGAS